MEQQGSFLLGALAAMMSKTGIIGFVGGQEYPNVINIEEGYKQGGKYINPNIKVLTSYVGEWNNPAKGKEIALTQINSGADFLLHVADTSGHGVIDAATKRCLCIWCCRRSEQIGSKHCANIICSRYG